jgi:hypothetical protein
MAKLITEPQRSVWRSLHRFDIEVGAGQHTIGKVIGNGE